MAEEKKDPSPEEKSDKPTFKTADDLSNFLMDLQGQMANMQETIDKLSPVEENAEENKEGNPEENKEETLSDEEINEIDQLLQSE